MNSFDQKVLDEVARNEEKQGITNWKDLRDEFIVRYGKNGKDLSDEIEKVVKTSRQEILVEHLRMVRIVKGISEHSNQLVENKDLFLENKLNPEDREGFFESIESLNEMIISLEKTLDEFKERLGGDE